MFIEIRQDLKGPDYLARQELTVLWRKALPTAAHFRMGHIFKPNDYEIRKPEGAGVEISMDPTALFD